MGRTALAAEGTLDTDGDGLPDIWEIQVFHTDPLKINTDGDVYNDREEIEKGFDPLSKERLKEEDFDQDGLSNRLELLFGTDPTNLDTDGDRFKDGEEVVAGFTPTSTADVRLQKSLRITLSTQRLERLVGGIAIDARVISTGKASTPTPTGTFYILNKHPRAWSRLASLWMPYWMGFTPRGHGIHELPEWPGGMKEGAAHLGKPVSHGCVRVGIHEAKKLYDWTPVGTPVVVRR